MDSPSSASPWPQRDDAPNIQDFLEFLENSLENGIAAPNAVLPDGGHARFAHAEKVRAYLAVPDQLHNILRELFPLRDYQQLPVDKTELLENYTQVFALLLKTSHGHFIRQIMQREEFSDTHLALVGRPVEHFPTVSTGNQDFFESFAKYKLMFCAPQFKYRKTLRWAPERILPIKRKIHLMRGGTADTYKIELHKFYNKLLDPSQIPDEASESATNNVFALKTFTMTSKSAFERELSAFRHMYNKKRRVPGLIHFYGAYAHGPTYNIILEYANKGDLEDYFANVAPPSTAEDILNFWKSILELLNGLAAIHKFEVREGNKSVSFEGWHQDVKPRNILVSSKRGGSIYECNFMLADLGSSQFKQAEPGAPGRAADGDRTRIYGAPEAYTSEWPARDKAVTTLADVFSLGAVYTVAATWALYNQEGIDEFKEIREEATKHLDDPGCFHDGRQVLQEVDSLFLYLLEAILPEDAITQAVLFELIRPMLSDSSERPHASTLYRKSKSVIHRAIEEMGARGQATNDSAEVVEPAFPPRSSAYSPPAAANPQHQSRSLPLQQQQQTTPLHPSEEDHVPEMTVFSAQRAHSPPTMAFGSQWAVTSSPPSSGTSHNTAGREQRASSTPESAAGYVPSTNSSPYDSPSKREKHRSSWFSSRFKRNSIPFPTPPNSSHNFHTASSSQSNSNHDQGRLGPSLFDHRNSATTPSLSTMATNMSAPVPTTGAHSGMPSPPIFGLARLSMTEEEAGPAPHQMLQHSATRTNTLATVLDNEIIEPLSVSTAWHYRHKRDLANLPNKHLLSKLDARDHVIIIDDSMTMKHQHWEELIALIDPLTWLLKRGDPDGMELSFVSVGRPYEHLDTSSKIVKLIKDHHLRGLPNSNVLMHLHAFLENYAAQLREHEFPNGRGAFVRPRTIYVFTDGLFRFSPEPQNYFQNVIDILESQRRPPDQLGIQFIRFGNDSLGRARLELLDDGLPLPRDIIDHESSRGDVWKMLLGPIHKAFDYHESQYLS